MTGIFLVVILDSTDGRAPVGLAPITTGLGLIHLSSTTVSNTSVNSARSLGPTMFAGGEAID
jgi:aquaporin Z